MRSKKILLLLPIVFFLFIAYNFAWFGQHLSRPFNQLYHQFYFNFTTDENETSRIDEAADYQGYKYLKKMTLMVRTAAKPPFVAQYYCLFLRSVFLFWPATYGNIALILDAEPEEDHKLGETLKRQVQTYYPDYNLNVFYEPLPKNASAILENRKRSKEYSRQMWSTFFSDSYSNESIIVYMDSDTLILTPLTRELLMKGDKLRVLGLDEIIDYYSSTTLKAMGFPLVVNFMVSFPQVIYRDTYTNCRNHIIKHLNTTTFEEAWNIFVVGSQHMSPWAIIMNYAWYFEKDRYDWHLNVIDLPKVNNRLPEGHKVLPEDLSGGVLGVAHTKTLSDHKYLTPGYCLSMSAQGEPLEGCENVTHNLDYICDDYKVSFHYIWPGPWCPKGDYRQCCQKSVDDHYKDMVRMAKLTGHRVQRRKGELVEKLAAEMGVKCEPLKLPLP